MESSRPSLLSRIFAIFILVIVAAIALRLAIGAVFSLIYLRGLNSEAA